LASPNGRNDDIAAATPSLQECALTLALTGLPVCLSLSAGPGGLGRDMSGRISVGLLDNTNAACTVSM